MIENNQIYCKEVTWKGVAIFAWKSFKTWDSIILLSGTIVTEPTIYTIPISNHLYINPVPFEWVWKYICHSCNPNAGIKSRNILTAMKNIEKDEEITIDYAMIVYEFSNWAPWADVICKCLSNNCRWRFVWYKQLDTETKNKYMWFISDYLLEE